MERSAFGRKGLLFSAVFLALVLTIGCADTQQARKVETSGFLGDYPSCKGAVKGRRCFTMRNPARISNGMTRSCSRMWRFGALPIRS